MCWKIGNGSKSAAADAAAQGKHGDCAAQQQDGNKHWIAGIAGLRSGRRHILLAPETLDGEDVVLDMEAEVQIHLYVHTIITLSNGDHGHAVGQSFNVIFGEFTGFAHHLFDRGQAAEAGTGAPITIVGNDAYPIGLLGRIVGAIGDVLHAVLIVLLCSGILIGAIGGEEVAVTVDQGKALDIVITRGTHAFNRRFYMGEIIARNKQFAELVMIFHKNIIGCSVFVGIDRLFVWLARILIGMDMRRDEAAIFQNGGNKAAGDDVEAPGVGMGIVVEEGLESLYVGVGGNGVVIRIERKFIKNIHNEGAVSLP